MAELAYVNNIDCYADALQVVLESIEMRIDPRMVLWCWYAIINVDHDELHGKLLKDTVKLNKETHQKLYPETFFYVAIPRFKIIRRDIPHLNCEIAIYYAACDITDDEGRCCWYGKILDKADSFQVPLGLIAPLIDALEKGETETADGRIIERGSDYSIYEFMNHTWKVPDAFNAFCWALALKGRDFSGLLDPVSCRLMAKFTKELPSPVTLGLPATGSVYEQIVSALTNLGYPKKESEQAANFALEKSPGNSSDVLVLIPQALKYFGGNQS
jgi:hypothetical protein